MRVSILTWSIFMLKLGLAVAQNGQDVRTIQSSFVLISVAASNLDAAVRSVSGDPVSTQALGPAMQGVENALAQARTDISTTQPISITDGIALQQTAETLAKSVKIMVMSTMLQRTMLDQTGATAGLIQSFKNQNMLSGALGQVVLSKLPAEGLSGAMMAFGGAAGSIGMGIASLSAPPLQLPLMPPGPSGPPAMTPPSAPAGAPASAAPAAPAAPGMAPPAAAPIPASPAAQPNTTAGRKHASKSKKRNFFS
ncbi:hypothetical protein CGCF415_v010758 [Colletotrichum fructicola]|nr:uncharacterized protein CGMCC3_g3836 [Colletotrichum fructicola]KAE9580144.1 hypothetical protein CGMCC3_g3836 [Colletotrichum fructicola]KAF4434027.1 hypothetical protein CFRS1_v010620 [Colletotrichum fructicola]KAF4889984.1 hypothetical protein CGCFRS4_v009017 [Colletotrichum fructicola]KAF4898699.1 hypothetical protein CGCF415_v010758 [Colletotrichum fructicola]KAF4941455.1 hypothetical protein CGCF245_v001499 [Colletotrichum fructicola]